MSVAWIRVVADIVCCLLFAILVFLGDPLPLRMFMLVVALVLAFDAGAEAVPLFSDFWLRVRGLRRIQPNEVP